MISELKYAKPEKFDPLHLVYHFTVPLTPQLRNEDNLFVILFIKSFAKKMKPLLFFRLLDEKLY